MVWIEVGEHSGAWVCEYHAPAYGMPANAMAFRLSGDDLAVLSPPAGAGAAGFDEIDTIGRVAAVVATSDYHSLGLAEWRARYPDAGAFAPEIALGFLARRGHQGLAPLSMLAAPPEVVFAEVPGTKRGGTHVITRRGSRPVVYLDELVINLTALPKRLPFKAMFWLFRAAPGIRLNSLYAMIGAQDSRAIAAAALAAIEGDPIIVLAHGEPLMTVTEIAGVRELLQEAVH